MRYTHLDKLFTLEGMIVAVITVVLTVLICKPRQAKAAPIPPAMNATTSDSASAVIHFTDARAPHEMQSALEREHMAHFQPVVKDGRLEFHAASKVNTAPCTFRLTFNAAHLDTNDYSLHIRMTWAHLPAAAHPQYHASFGSWLSLWCRDLKVQPSASGVRLDARYQARVDQALAAEAGLADLSVVQQAILSAVKSGAKFHTSHKEGGTNIGYASGVFYREDFGEWTARETFPDDSAFLAFLRKFYDWDTSRSVAPTKVPDETAWRLILRLLKHT
jgi:hypothetical protein